MGAARAVRPEMGLPESAEADEGEDPRAAPRRNLLEVVREKLDARPGVRSRDPYAALPSATPRGASFEDPAPLSRPSIRAPSSHAPSLSPDRSSSVDQGAKGVNAIPARMVLLCENHERVESADAFSAYFDELVAATRSASTSSDESSDESSVSGVALVYPDAALAVLEATARGVNAAARFVETTLERAPFHSPRVCACTDDAARAFQTWHPPVFVNAKTLDVYEPEEDEKLLKTTSEVNHAMLELGEKLRADEASGGKSGVEKTLKTLANAFEALPSTQTLVGLLRSPNGAPTVEEYLDVYDAALDVDLDSEKQWPMPPPLAF